MEFLRNVDEALRELVHESDSPCIAWEQNILATKSIQPRNVHACAPGWTA